MRTPSIKEQIASGKSQIIKDDGFRLREPVKINDTIIIINIQSILTPYKIKMKEYIHTYILNDKDIVEYEYRPEKLSFDVYGTIELAPLILEINNMESATQFCDLENGIKLFDGNIIDFLNEILIIEKKNINANRSKVNKELYK